MVEKRQGEELDDFTFKQPRYSEPGNSSWVTSDENVRSEAAFRILLSPDYYNTEDHVSIIVHPRVIYYSLLDIPPQKLIPMGIDFQAELPESARDDHVKFNKFEGTCVIPMPELEVGGKLPGNGRTECFCEDIGSIRCVKQHIEESRVFLKMIIGTETFCKLGLNDMGEVVTEKWSEEENKIFHEVIYSNPESLGLNFWDQLVKVFPLRTKTEIVSYYFNVFMLRKRAEQNRCGNLSDIDSDNDELEASDEEPEKINDNRINSGDRENESFINQEIICDDMVDQSICNADICYRGELNSGPDVETGSCNLRFDDEQRDPDCQNGDSKDVHEDREQRDLDCQNGDSKDDDEDREQRDLDFQNGDSKDVNEGREQRDPDCENGDSKDVDEDREQRDLDFQNGDSKDVDEDRKQPDPDCEIGDWKDVDEDREQRDLDCENGDSKDVDEHHLRAFGGNKDSILPQT